MFKKNLEKLKQDLNKNNIDLAVITDDDSIYYFTGYFDFLHMSFGRPTILLVPKDADTVLITPLIDSHLVKKFMSMGLKVYVKIFDKDKDALAFLVEDL